MIKTVISGMISTKGEVSSTRAIYVLVNLLAAMIILCIVIGCTAVMILEALKPQPIQLDYFVGMGDLIYKSILAASVLILFAGITKVATDKIETQSDKKETQSDKKETQ